MPSVAVYGLDSSSERATLSVHLARSLAFSGQTVLIVDLDPLGDVTAALGASRQRSGLIWKVLDGLESESHLGALIRSVEPGLDLLPSDLQAPQTKGNSEGPLQVRLRDLESNYQWVIYDFSKSLGALCQMILSTTTHILVPIRFSSHSPLDQTRIMDLVELARGPLSFENLWAVPMVDYGMAPKRIQDLKAQIYRAEIPSSVTTLVAFGDNNSQLVPSIEALLESPNLRPYLKLAKEVLLHVRKEARSRP